MRQMVLATAPIGALAGCGSQQAASHTPVAATQTTHAKATAQTNPTAGHKAPPGSYTDTQTGMTAAVLGAVVDTTGGAYVPPKSGHFYEELHIQIKNGGSSPHDWNEFDFSAVDDKGQTYNGAYSGRNDQPSLGSGSMPKGELRSGWVAFEVPTSAKTLTVTWDDAYNLSPAAELVKYTLKP
jgi:Domain of unknown function (DUF4352)